MDDLQPGYVHARSVTLDGWRKNVFAGRDRRYPLLADLGLAEAKPAGERDTRYPRVDPAGNFRADPEVILLPDEPFGFDESHRKRLSDLWLALQR